MPVLDASSALYAWDNYPIHQFPPLWSWLALQVATGKLTTAAVAYSEIDHKSHDCALWLKAQKITVHPVTQAVLLDALRMKQLLGIQGELYGSGVGENDLFIVAIARAQGADLLTDEARQPSLPLDRRKYKIPAVCALPEVQVRTWSFVEYIKRSQVVFG
jgi:predicted nucleic acid-binding protein